MDIYLITSYTVRFTLINSKLSFRSHYWRYLSSNLYLVPLDYFSTKCSYFTLTLNLDQNCYLVSSFLHFKWQKIIDVYYYMKRQWNMETLMQYFGKIYSPWIRKIWKLIGSVEMRLNFLQQSKNQRLEIRKFDDIVRLPVSMDVASTICIA